MTLYNSAHIKVKIACIWLTTLSRPNYRHCSWRSQGSSLLPPTALVLWAEAQPARRSRVSQGRDGYGLTCGGYRGHRGDRCSEEAAGGLTLPRVMLALGVNCPEGSHYIQYTPPPPPPGHNCPEPFPRIPQNLHQLPGSGGLALSHPLEKYTLCCAIRPKHGSMG